MTSRGRTGSPVRLALLVSQQTTLDLFVAVEKRLLVRQGVFPTDAMRGPTGEPVDPQMAEEMNRLIDLLRQAVDDV